MSIDRPAARSRHACDSEQCAPLPEAAHDTARMIRRCCSAARRRGDPVLVARRLAAQRLEWKTRDPRRDRRAPRGRSRSPVPAAPDPVADRYRRVRADGRRCCPARSHVYTAGPGGKVGYRVDRPAGAGRRPPDPARPRLRADRGRRTRPRPPGPVAVTGNLVWPRTTDRPSPDREANIWFARDVPAMAEALGTEPVDGRRGRERDPPAARCRCRSPWRSRTTISAMRSPGSASPRSGR